MPSYRQPKGVYSRSTADWFVNSMCWGGASFHSNAPGPPWLSAIISLYNDATDGSYLEVQAYSAGCDGGIAVNVDFQTGTFGSLVTQGHPVQFDMGQLPGQIWMLPTSSSTEFDPGPIANPFTSLPGVFDSSSSLSGLPFWRVPAKTSLRFAANEFFSDIAIALWWGVLKVT